MTVKTPTDNKSAFQYHRDILPKFASIYDPILETGLFSYVGYFRMYRNQKCLFPMGYNSNIIEKYITNVISCGSYYPNHCQNIEDVSLALWPENFCKNDMPLNYLQHLRIGQGISIYKRFPDYIEGLYVCPKNNTINLNSIAATKASLFQEIREEVSGKAAFIFESNKPIFIHFKGLFSIDLPSKEDFLEKKILNLLAILKKTDFATSRPLKRQVALTKRQAQTILASLHGQTSKEAARTLAITPRTVDDHWKAIQGKFQERLGVCYSRSQIIETFLEEVDLHLNTSSATTLIKDIQKYRESLKSLCKSVYPL
tara:strand:- start:282 stop:1220 length:939 start_codon:yes stop_codon:yes gene_type:complete